MALVEVLNLLAVCSYGNGRDSDAMNYACQSAAIGQEQGYIRSFVDEGSQLLPILKNLQRREKKKQEECSVTCDYLANIILETRKHLKKMQAAQLTHSAQHTDELIESLTPREMTVLRCLAQDLSNQGIAKQLKISISTVKVHTRNIYGKLAVCNRTQAVATAREMKLI